MSGAEPKIPAEGGDGTSCWRWTGERWAPASDPREGPPAADGLWWGDASFETARVTGRRLVGWAWHRDRLDVALRTSGVAPMGVPFEVDGTVGAAAHALELDDSLPSEGRLRVTVAGHGTRPDGSYAGVRATLTLAAFDEPDYEAGATLVIDPHEHPGTGWLGKSVSYQWARVAYRRARIQDADDALLVRDGMAVETTCAAIAWKIGEVWYTSPRRLGALASTTVRRIESTGVRFVESERGPAELAGSDAVVLLNALWGAWGVRSLMGKDLDAPDRAAAPLRERLQRTARPATEELTHGTTRH